MKTKFYLWTACIFMTAMQACTTSNFATRKYMPRFHSSTEEISFAQDKAGNEENAGKKRIAYGKEPTQWPALDSISFSPDGLPGTSSLIPGSTNQKHDRVLAPLTKTKTGVGSPDLAGTKPGNISFGGGVDTKVVPGHIKAGIALLICAFLLTLGAIGTAFLIYPALISAIFSIVLFIMGLMDISKSPENLKGKGTAIAGLILGFQALLTACIVAIILFIAGELGNG